MLFLLFCLNALAQQGPLSQPTTEIISSPLLELGFTKTIKPVEEHAYNPNYSSFSEALNNFSGLQTKTTGSPTLSIRGSQSSARVLTLLEGVSLNFADGLGLDPLFIPFESLQSVTVLKGSSASTFGKDALSGAINFNLKNTLGRQVRLSYGSFNSKEVSTNYGDEKIFASAFFSHSDGNYPYSINRLSLSGLRERNNQETLRATFKYFKKNIKSFHLISRQIGSTPGSVESPSASSYNNVGHLHSLFLNFKPFSTQTSLAVAEKNFDNTPIKTQSIKQNTKYKTEINSFNIDIFNELSFEHFYASYLDSGSKYIAYNEAGINIEHAINDQTALSLATRFEFNSNQLISALGLNKSINTWAYYFSYSQGYRPPSLTQKYSQTSYFIGNPNLKPERSDEFSVGLEKSFNLNVLKFEAFLRTMTDLLENRTIAPGLQQAQNIGQAQAYGFDAGYTTSVSGFMLKPQISYLQNKNLHTNEPITLSPEIQISAAIEKDFKIFNLNLDAIYWQNYYDRSASSGNLVLLPSWVVINLNLTKALTKNLELVFSIFNLTDQPRELTLGYPEPQRSFKLALIGSF